MMSFYYEHIMKYMIVLVFGCIGYVVCFHKNLPVKLNLYR